MEGTLCTVLYILFRAHYRIICVRKMNTNQHSQCQRKINGNVSLHVSCNLYEKAREGIPAVIKSSIFIPVVSDGGK
jgi:hypothetical protein